MAASLAASVALIAALDAKIAEHKDQLAQVAQLLALQPTDESLRLLHADISTELTNALQARIQFGVVPAALPTAASAAAAATVPPPLPPQHKTDTPAATTSSSAAGGPPPLPTGAAAAAGAASVSAASSGADLSLAAYSASGVRKWQLKERCLAQWTDGKYYSARIDSISEILTYRVTYLDYGNTAELTVNQLFPYLHAPAGLLKPGVLVRAIWPDDGLFYDAKIEGQGSARNLFFVKFTKYKKTQIEVPVTDIIIRKPSLNAFGEGKDTAAAVFAPTAAAGAQTASAGAAAFGATGGLTEDEIKQLLALQTAPEYSALAISAAASAAAAGAGGAALPKKELIQLSEKVVIPENLTILPTDNEQTRALKLKKIKRLKNKHRHAVLELEGEKKQNSWQKFTQKAARVSGGAVAGAAAGGAAKPVGAAEKKLVKNKDAIDSLKVLGHKRKSIFSSPDSVDGRVGVTGSGKSMTEYKDMGRAKFVKGDGTLAAAPAVTTPLPGYDD